MNFEETTSFPTTGEKRCSKAIGLIMVAVGVVAAVLMLASCAHTPASARMAGGYEAIAYANDHRQEYVDSRELSPEIRKGVLDRKIIIGMTKDDVQVGLGYVPSHTATLAGNDVWFWDANRHHLVFTFSGQTNRLIRVRSR